VNVRVLCVNLGSRTAKLSVLDVPEGAVAGEPREPEAALETPLDQVAAEHHLAALGAEHIACVAYRVVRSSDVAASDAERFSERTRTAILGALEYAPLHVRPVIAAYDALSARLPGARHIAVFDAAFHRTIEASVAANGLPYDDFAAGWRKIGFHGLSHAYAAARTATLLGDPQPVRKLVSAHRGGGASVAAIDGARSVDTTMGFTPLDGLIMATRSGTLDPGMLLAYMRRKGLSIEDTEQLLSLKSGLLGLGGSADMREIVAAKQRGDGRATLAYSAFVYRVRAAIGSMLATLAGIDAIAFLGGIGENASGVRRDVCEPFAFAGVTIDNGKNEAPSGDAVLSADGAAVAVLRIHTREDWMMALAARNLA
jgi:acetate kinase